MVYNVEMAVLLARGPETRSEALIDALREAILTGQYRPGEHLVQEELAERFGISRIPLREALRRLEGEGLVIISPNRGATVRPLAPKDVVDLYDLRLALESLALRRAAERYADLREPTARRHAEAKLAVESGALTKLFHLDRDFHADLAAASDNPHLIAALGSQWSQIMLVMHAYLKVGTYTPNVWEEHEGLANAVAHGDADGAVEKLRIHLTTSRDRILSDLREHEAP
jgi:DNA-binding GntR family transcriptional regulator